MMSNKSRLEAVSSSLDTAITMANNLSSIEDGGGGVQYKIGEMTMSTTGVTVSGLGFKPKQVVAYSTDSFSCDSVSYLIKLPIFVCGGELQNSIAYHKSNNSVAVSTTSYATLIISDDGFTINGGSGFTGTFNDGVTWKYIAFG